MEKIESIYEKYPTGTLAPLLSRNDYSEDEKTVLLHFFTNIDKNIYCARDAMSSQLYAFLVGQYSRSELSMRDRFLQLFTDGEKALAAGKIGSDEFVSLSDLAAEIRANPNNAIEYFNKRASSFLKKWGVDYGHNSLKDADRVRFAIENISQVFTNIIEAPFPTLGDFQEKSTRYVPFSKEKLIYPKKLKESKFAEEIVAVCEGFMDMYEKYLPILKDALVAHGVVKKEDFKHERAFENTLNAKAFDNVRYLLPSNVSTSLGAGFSTRTLESHLSWMLSSELEEVRVVAAAMLQEALKVSPGLLSRVSVNDYFVEKRGKSFELVEDIFASAQQPEIICGIDDCNRIKIAEMDDNTCNIDEIVIASILYHYAHRKGASFADCLNRVKFMGRDAREKVLESELGDRGTFDRIPRSVRHGSVVFDMLVDAGAYRDVMRHRASAQLYQGISAIHGYDYPEHIELHGLEEFKKEYDEIMIKASELSRKLILEEPYEIEYVAALGHLVRGTIEMDPGQMAYVIELRTTPQGHQSYRRLFQQAYNLLEKKAPMFSKYIRVNQDLEASRLAQEEKSAARKKELGI